MKPLILALVSASALILLGALTRTPRPAGIDPAGWLPVVIVTAPGPSLTMDEVVVRAGQPAGISAIPSKPALN